MRVLFAVALIALGLAGVSAASAADLPFVQRDNYNTSAFDQRAEQFVIYDNQPGVLVRAYWRAPWRHHHYYPATGKRPRVGRHENLSAASRPSKPAKTFRRSWSNAWAFEYEMPLVGALSPDDRPAPHAEQRPQTPGVAK